MFLLIPTRQDCLSIILTLKEWLVVSLKLWSYWLAIMISHSIQGRKIKTDNIAFSNKRDNYFFMKVTSEDIVFCGKRKKSFIVITVLFKLKYFFWNTLYFWKKWTVAQLTLYQDLPKACHPKNAFRNQIYFLALLLSKLFPGLDVWIILRYLALECPLLCFILFFLTIFGWPWNTATYRHVLAHTLVKAVPQLTFVYLFF